MFDEGAAEIVAHDPTTQQIIEVNADAFIGLERVGGIMMYDVTNPYPVLFVTL